MRGDGGTEKTWKDFVRVRKAAVNRDDDGAPTRYAWMQGYSCMGNASSCVRDGGGAPGVVCAGEEDDWRPG
jgi:hypothetical protein